MGILRLKYYIVFALISMTFHASVSAKGYAQSLTETYMTVKLEDALITDFFSLIEQETPFSVIYSNAISTYPKRTSLSKDKISVDEVLNFLKAEYPITYQYAASTISVKAINPPKANNQPIAQNEITGTVNDDTGPLPGVNVRVVGTQRGASTDFDGNYTITASPGEVLQFSYVGFQTQQIEVGDQQSIDVVMLLDTNTLNEVVMIGYGATTRRKVTTSISSINEEVIENRPFTSAEQALVGTTPGVSVVQASGRPGGNISVNIRGTNSIFADANPLYIVDGVQVLNTAGIDPANIESIDILKDASALAIYGSRSSAGVVIITTKRGAKNDFNVNFSSYVGQDRVINTLEVLNSQQYINYLNTSLTNAGLAPVTDPFGFQNNTDWQKELYDPAFIQNYQIAFSGGKEKSNYYISASYRNQEGVIEPSYFERYSLRVNADFEMSDRFKIGNSIALSRNNDFAIADNARVNQGGVVLSALQTPTTIPIQNEDGTYPGNPYQPLDNPIALVRGQQLEALTYKVLANVYGEYEVLDNLQFKSSFSIDLNAAKVDNFIDPFTTQNGIALEGQATNQNFDELVWTWDNTISYTLKLSDDLGFDILGGITSQESQFESSFLVGQGFASAAIQTAEAAAEAIDVGAAESTWSNFSYFTRINADYKGKYLFSSTLRNDGSSRFGADFRTGLYYATSGAWIISAEDVMQDVSWLNFLKIRYGYGVLGNQDFNSDFAFASLYGTGGNYPIGGIIAPAAFPLQPGNSALKWESTEGHNVGLNANFLDNRITLIADAYYKRTYDLLLDKPLPITSGFVSSIQNVGEMINRGIDGSLTIKPVRGDHFSWNIDGNISFNRNEVTDLGGIPVFGGGIADQGQVSIVTKGEPIANFYGWTAEGIDPNTGNIIFRDLDGNGIVDDEDRTIIGNALPDYTWGASSTFSFKGLELFIFFQGSEGGDIYNATRFELENQATFKNQSIAVLDRWTPTNTDGTVPIAVFGDPARNGRASTRWVEDGSFVKLREITLSYNLPPTLLSYLKMTNFRVYAQGRNLYTWTGYSGYDPEVSRDGGNAISRGIDYGTYPQVESILFGVNMTF